MRTLVYHTGGIGDFITTLPALEYWKQIKRCSLHLLGRPYIAEVTNLFDEVYDVDSKLFLPLFNKDKKEYFFTFFNKFDNVILFCHSDSPLLKNIEETFPIDRYKWQFPFPTNRIHIIDYHFSLFYSFPEELSISLRIPHLNFSQTSFLLSKNSLQEEKLLVAIHPGSGSKIKNWEYSNFKKVALILKEKGAKILWILGPAENYPNLLEDDIVIQNISLKECGMILKKCNLFIGNDSGISHLASAVGCKTLVIFGHSDPVVWTPRSREMVKVIWKAPSCGPCHPIKTKNNNCDFTCLNSISPEEVIAAADKILFRK